MEEEDSQGDHQKEAYLEETSQQEEEVCQGEDSQEGEEVCLEEGHPQGLKYPQDSPST
jgi:hypothetical protein